MTVGLQRIDTQHTKTDPKTLNNKNNINTVSWPTSLIDKFNIITT